MKQFKVGDRVRVIHSTGQSGEKYIGWIGTIYKCMINYCMINFDKERVPKDTIWELYEGKDYLMSNDEIWLFVEIELLDRKNKLDRILNIKEKENGEI